MPALYIVTMLEGSDQLSKKASFEASIMAISQ
jgi:hypothetical protein